MFYSSQKTSNNRQESFENDVLSPIFNYMKNNGLSVSMHITTPANKLNLNNDAAPSKLSSLSLTALSLKP